MANKAYNHFLLNDLMNGKNWPNSTIFPEPTETKPHEHFWFNLFGQMKTMPANSGHLRKGI
jgi:hypothetical protein